MDLFVDNQFTRFDSSQLKENKVVDYNIYYKKDNEYVLAFSLGMLTQTVIARLKKLELNNDGLYVDSFNDSYSDKFVEVEEVSQAFKKEKRKYEKCVDDCKNMIDNTYRNETIDMATSTKVSTNIKHHIVTSEISNILQFINSLRKDDKYLYTHSTNVAYLNGIMGKWLHLPDESIQKLVLIGLLHDIGKLQIPKEILDKPGVLTTEEFEIIKLHPIYSFQILAKSGFIDLDILLAVRGHHERNNGTGYPDGLTVNKLSLYTRITTISDIYDAMVAKRCYKRSHSPFEILDVFAKGRFSNLDTQIVNMFLTNMPKELMGKNVALSNGDKGIIQYINPLDFAHPFVKVGENIYQTSEELKCMYIC